MAVASRKTHIVRIQAPDETKTSGANGPMYIDIEVLDCIAYRTTNGHVHVWDCKSKNADPFIEDKTGDDPDWSAGSENSSRGSHAKAFTGPKDEQGATHGARFDYEVLDRISFTDDQRKVWILDHPQNKADAFNVTTGKGSKTATRRTHLEQINATYTSGGTGGSTNARVGAFGKDPNTQKKNDGTSMGCIVQERVDIVAFQGLNEKRLIINLESHDDQDPDNADANKKRATTITDPPGYDPNDPNGPKPPLITTTRDLNKYFKIIVDHDSGGPIIGGGFSGYEWQAEVIAGGAPNFGDTIFSLPIFNTPAQALADYESINDPPFLGPPTIVFVKTPPFKIGDRPPSVTARNVDTGTLAANNGADGTFISMGPLWWVRKWSPDGTD